MKIKLPLFFAVLFLVSVIHAQKGKTAKPKAQKTTASTTKSEPVTEPPKSNLESKNHAAFSEALQLVKNELQTVENNKTQINQTISEVQPGVVKLNLTYTTIKDGKSTSELYEFNMADIDLNTVRTLTNKDVIQVQLLVGKKQKLIRKTSENQKVSFQDAIMIYAKNIDNGRNLVDLLKSLIPLSNEIIENRLSLKTYQEHMNWLGNNIKDVKLTEKQYVQKISVNSKYPGRLELSVDVLANQKSTNYTYQFNLANLNVNSIYSEIKGDEIVVNVETKRKLKSVKAFSANEQKDYVNDFSVNCESVEKARDLQKVLKSAIALSEDKIENSIPKIKTIAEGVAIIDSYIKNITINTTTYNQSFSGDCVVTFNKKESTPTKMTEEEFFFNMKDLGKNLVKYYTNGKNVEVELQAKAGNKFIKYTLDKEVKNYSSKFQINFAEVEDAMVAERVLGNMIELCENTELKLTGSKNELLLDLKNNIKKVEVNRIAIEQSLEIKDEKTVQFKSTEVSEKASKTKLFEFNFGDINPATVAIKTSSANVYVTVNTNYMEKIIKYYEDGAIKNYQSSFDIYTSNIEEARRIVELFKKILQK